MERANQMGLVTTKQWFCDFSSEAKTHLATFEITPGQDPLGNDKVCSCAKHLQKLQEAAFNKGYGRLIVTQVPTMEVN